MNVTLFSTDCPRCKILESKLAEKKIAFNVIKGDQAIEYISSRGFMSAPLLMVDGTNYEFGKAIRWVNEYENKH